MTGIRHRKRQLLPTEEEAGLSGNFVQYCTGQKYHSTAEQKDRGRGYKIGLFFNIEITQNREQSNNRNINNNLPTNETSQTEATNKIIHTRPDVEVFQKSEV